ncbi:MULTISPECIES: alkaline phosphatase family protein [Bacillus]|uniref:alkaline phosphatase family protein n=1 Tax=Bacillus TaxID=1386 RepID=UPI000BB72953|nr:MULTISPECIES: alkaline phosphatase family protein [Bacillus]
MMRKVLIICILILLFNTSCQSDQFTSPTNSSSKKIIMIMVDSMTDELLQISLQEGVFPALRFLMENGQVYDNLVAPFPSMSVTIEATLITGQMPNEHKVPGLTWYDAKEDRIIDYGTSIETLRKLGVKESLEDAFYHLNNSHLNKDSKTIFEELHDNNQSSGSINLLVHRGRTKHELEAPFILEKTIGLDDKIETYGPDIFSYGSFHRPSILQNELLSDALILRAGFTDNYAAEVITELMQHSKQPDFLLAFFPEMDKKTHRNGPPYVNGFKEVEQHIKRILDVYEDWNDALEDNIFILFGDHGQDALAEDETLAKIDLHSLYGDYKIAKFTEKPSSGDIVISNNHRMAYIEPLKNGITKVDIARTGIEDERIALTAYLEDDWVKVWSPDHNENLLFRQGNDWTDSYGQQWDVKGSFDLLKVKENAKEKTVQFTDYPDAFNQLMSALKSQPNSVVVTGKPGYVVFSETAPVHNGGGEHGGLHKNDTHASLIIAGTEKMPDSIRIVDLKSYILDLLNEN